MRQGATVHELKCDIDFTLFLKGTIRLEHVIMVAIVQSLELDQDLLSQLLILLERDLFESYDLFRWFVNCFFYHTSRTLA